MSNNNPQTTVGCNNLSMPYFHMKYIVKELLNRITLMQNPIIALAWLLLMHVQNFRKIRLLDSKLQENAFFKFWIAMEHASGGKCWR